jgi:tripartite ATP-independent transporter DctP family solute receptor
MKKFGLIFLVIVLFISIIVSWTTFAAVKPIKLVYGNVMPADHYFSKADRYFKELVEKNSKGQILIDFFPTSQLGSVTEQIQATKSGAQQIFFGSFPNAYIPKLQALELPYLFRDEAHQIKVARNLTSVIDENELAAKANMHILGLRLSPARHLTTKFPVNKLEDLKGLKIRVPEMPLYLATWRALGASPVVIPPGDTYTALATGTADAQENPLATIISFKFYEQQRYCALTGHVRPIYPMMINNSFWKSLTKEQQKIIADAAAKSCQLSETLRKKSEEDDKNFFMKAGIKFTEPDLAPFREKAKTIWSQFVDQEWINKIEAIQ